MPVKLDDESKTVIARFLLKVGISLVLASLGEMGRTVGLEGWLALYGLACAIYAIGRGDKIWARRFTYWDEAVWLVAASAVANFFLQGTI